MKQSFFLIIYRVDISEMQLYQPTNTSIQYTPQGMFAQSDAKQWFTQATVVPDYYMTTSYFFYSI